MPDWQEDYSTILAVDQEFGGGRELLDNPLEYLEQQGCVVSADQLKEAAQADTVPVETVKRGAAAIAASTRWWGVKIAFDHATTQKIAAGTTVGAGLTGGIATPLAAVPVVGSALALMAGSVAAALTVESGAVGLADRGNGINLKWTWVQIALITSPMSLPSLVSMCVPYSS